jgi:predicted RecB family nuclease
MYRPGITPSLSKSKFLAGCQCLKRLYLKVYEPELAPEPDEAAQARFDQGYEVGRLATKAFPDGVLVDEDYLHHKKAVAHTQALMADKYIPAIFEAAFTYQNVKVRVDILERLPKNRWRFMEVKSTASLKDTHYDDVAIQKYVLEGCGLNLAESCLMHLNREYVYPGGEYDLEQLFVINDLTDDLDEISEKIPVLLAEQKRILSLPNPPDVPAGDQCSDPYECEFFGLCNEEKSENWLGYLPGVGPKGVKNLFDQGIELIHDIPEDFGLTDLQQRACCCVKNGKPYISEDIHKEFEKLDYPLYFMDFETYNPAIPRYAGMRPFDQIPFQWSVHVQRHPGGELEHYEFLAENAEDPREDFITSLLQILEDDGEDGNIIAYYASFETSRLDDLAGWFPKYAPRIDKVKNRLWDLHPVIKDYVYHPEFYGSLSLKAVLPALIPHMTYEGMDVADGIAAGITFERMIKGESSESELESLRNALLEYCGQDTLAMVELIRTLQTDA